MNGSLPPLVQDQGVPFDLFIQALTDQLDKAQAAMAVKARVAKMPLTFAVKDVTLDLRAFVSVIDDDIFIRPAAAGDTEASSLKLSMTTITKPMIEENAVDFAVEDPKLQLRQALGDSISEDEQRKLERIGVRTITQLNELKRTAGTDVIARLARMPMNRLQQALMRASEPRVTQVKKRPAPITVPTPVGTKPLPSRLHLRGANLLRGGRVPLIRAAGIEVPIVTAQAQELVLEPRSGQLGETAEIDFGDGTKIDLLLDDDGEETEMAG